MNFLASSSSHGGLIAMMAVMCAIFVGLLIFELRYIKTRQFAMSDLLLGFLLDLVFPGISLIVALIFKILSTNSDTHSIDGKISGMLLSLIIDGIVGFIVGMILIARL